MLDQKIDRRKLIATGAAASLLATTGARAKSKASCTPNQGFEDFAALFRLVSDLGGPSTYRFHSGTALIVPAPLQLAEDFLGYVALKQDRVRRLPNGDFHHAYTGGILFTDATSGKVINKFENRFTGETVDVKHFATSGGSLVYTPKGTYGLKPGADATATPKLSKKQVELGWGTTDSDAWITYPERFAFYDADGNFAGADNSMYRYHGRLADLRNPSISSVDTVMTWQSETGLWDWMNMGDHPGHLIFGGMGRKYSSSSDLPMEYVQAYEVSFPNQLSRSIDWNDFTIPNAYR